MWLDKDGNLTATKTHLTLGEADGFKTTDGGKTWTKTFAKVAVGTYKVTETNTELDGYTFVSSKSTTSASATVTKDAAVTANLKNVYKEETNEEDEELASLTVNKYVTGTKNFVAGAKLTIVDKATGETVATWTTKRASYDLDELFEVGKTYILKETSAPSGYTKAANVEFKFTDVDTVKIVSGSKTSAKKTNATCSDSTLNLYDAKKSSSSSSTTRTTSHSNPRTGDDTAGTVGILSLVSLLSVGLFVFARRRAQSEQ